MCVLNVLLDQFHLSTKGESRKNIFHFLFYQITEKKTQHGRKMKLPNLFQQSIKYVQENFFPENIFIMYA